MSLALLSAFALYSSILAYIAFCAFKKNSRSSDYTLGNRSLNYWVTALAAQASDMGVWLFMGFPAAVYANGVGEAWVAVGLTFCMFLSWLIVAPKLRTLTEKYDATTLPSFFEKRFSDTSGLIRITSAIVCILFFMFYIASSFVALGYLFNEIFGLSYFAGISIGSVVVFYILLGGFLSLAWIDTFQGLFLLAMLILVVIAVVSKTSTSALCDAVTTTNKQGSWFNNLYNALAWGLGYFGMPHIITKFMGIKDVRDTHKAMVVGIAWQILATGTAVCIGLLGLSFFQTPLAGKEMQNLIFVMMTKELFSPFFAGIVLCAVIASTINNMGAQVLACTSVLAEDVYSKFFSRKRSHTNIQNASRIGVLLLCLSAFIFAYFNRGKGVYELVLYAWSGLGSAFGPLVLVSLHTKMRNRYAAFAGILGGALTAGIVPFFAPQMMVMIPAFAVSFACMGITHFLCKN